MRRLGRVLTAVAVFLVVTWPWLGVALLAVAKLTSGPRPPAGILRAWLLAWGPLLALGIAHARWGSGGDVAWPWAGLAIVLGWLVVGRRAATFAPMLLGLVAMLAALAAERTVASTTWHPAGHDDVGLDRYLAALDGQQLDGAAAYERVWRGADVAGATLITFEMRRIDGYDRRTLSPPITRPSDGGTLPEPAAARLAVVVPNTPPAEWITQVEAPTPEWRIVTVRADDPRLARDADLHLVIELESGTTIEVRRASARRLTDDAAAPVGLTPSPRPRRGRVWFEHPNLAGHSLALAGLLTTTLAPTPIAMVATAATTLTGVALTGSRAAWLVTIVGLLALTLRVWRLRPARRGGRRRDRIPLLLTLLVLTTLVGLSLRGSTPADVQVLGRGSDNEVTRSEILAFTLRTMLAHPLGGIGEDGFHEHWSAAHPDDDRVAPRHGHNLWLHLGTTYGVPGFVVTLWLAVVLLWAAWRWGGHHGRVVVIAAFVLQLTDITLAHPGVYAPLLLAMVRSPEVPTDPPT